MHRFSTVATKSSGVLHRLRATRKRVPPTRKRVPPASSTYYREYVCGGLPSRVAQRTQAGAFVAS